MKIQDLALSSYRFCARKTLKDDEAILWDDFAGLLSENVKKIGGLENTTQKTIEQKTPKSGHFVPILNSTDNSSNEQSAVVFHDGFYRTLTAGIFLDVYVLQEWAGLSQKYANISQLLKASEKLKSQIGDYTKLESELPAECFCYFTEFTSSNFDPAKIFSALLETDNFSAVEVDYAQFAFSFSDEKTVAVIISKNFAETEAKEKSTKFFDELLREYFLSFAKVAFEIQNIRNLKAQSARQVLLEYLDWFEKNPPKTLSEIENANRDLTRYRVDLAEKIKAVEIHLHTIGINIRNAEKILDNSLLQQKKDELRQILISPLDLQAEQIKADLTYLNIYEEKAKLIGEEIANLSNLQAGIYGRKLAWLFGLMALIGAFQLFPEFQNWGNYGLKIAILAVIILTPILILFGREIKDAIFNPSKNTFQPLFTKKSEIAENNLDIEYEELNDLEKRKHKTDE